MITFSVKEDGYYMQRTCEASAEFGDAWFDVVPTFQKFLEDAGWVFPTDFDFREILNQAHKDYYNVA